MTSLKKWIGLADSYRLKKENRRITLVNGFCIIGLSICILFSILDIYLQYWIPLLWVMSGGLILVGIYFLNKKGRHTVAKYAIIAFAFAFFLLNTNYLFIGRQAEFFYILVLVMTMLLTDNLIVQIVTLVIIIISFYLPNYLFNHYPEGSFGYPNVLAIFLAIFFAMRHFISLNNSYEKILTDDNRLISKQKTELELLQKFQQNFYVNVSHEIRTPLTLINGNLNNINRSDQQYTKKISEQVQKITSLLDDIMDLSKINSGKLELKVKPTNLNYLIHKQYQMFESLFEHLNIEFHLYTPDYELWALADQKYLERCLNNLLNNASKFTEQNGSVSLSLENENDTIKISIKDNGIGIKKEDKERIFKQYEQSETSNEQGTGLGLTFVKETVELMGGEVSVSSEINKGSIFTLSLTKTEQSENDSSINKAYLSLDKSIRILLVDDNPEMLSYLKNIFEDHCCRFASNGIEALEILGQEKFDCVITDYMMPKMDGIELFSEIKNRSISVCCIMLTSRTDQESKLKALRLGLDDYLLKPFIEEELLLRVKFLTANKKEQTSTESPRSIDKIPKERTSFIKNLNEIISVELTNKDFKVTDLAERLNVSLSTLSRSIKSFSGLTAKQYIKECRLQRARIFLETNPTINIKSLALEVGLKNQTYFTIEYEKRFGTNLRKRK